MADAYSYTYTVFTPTFNRKHTLHRVYESLRAQTFRDFEWIVVDDGSVDGTGALVAQWQAEADFPVIYHYQENSGKHIAFNQAVQLARGELFLVIDSDDGFTPDALAAMLKAWQEIEVKSDYTGVVVLARYDDGHISGKPFPNSPFDTDALSLNYEHRLPGERWGFHRTDVLKEFPFPEDNKNVRFVPENIVWDAIARKYKIRCINEVLRIYYQDSGNQVTRANPKKKALVKDYFLQLLNRDFDYFRFAPKPFIKYAILYIRYSLHLGEYAFLLPRKFAKAQIYLLNLLVMPIAFALFFKDKWNP